MDYSTENLTLEQLLIAMPKSKIMQTVEEHSISKDQPMHNRYILKVLNMSVRNMRKQLKEQLEYSNDTIRITSKSVQEGIKEALSKIDDHLGIPNTLVKLSKDTYVFGSLTNTNTIDVKLYDNKRGAIVLNRPSYVALITVVKEL